MKTVTILTFMLVLRAAAANQPTFKGAVYEHAAHPPLPECVSSVCDRSQAKETLQMNLEEYSKQAKLAKDQGADIIVFPEFGLVGVGLVRSTLWPFSEVIPSLSDSGYEWVPCIQSWKPDSDQFVQSFLSCVARNNKIFVAANMLDQQKCQECGEDRCLYNTEVVFDTDGKYLAKYHKYNLFDTEFPWFNIDQEPENVYVDSPFGRLGFSICEDIMFTPPTVSLVDEYHIDTMIFSTEWWDEYPHQIPTPLFSAWARGLQINWLASNFHDSTFGCTGSGIFSTDGPLVWYHNNSQSAGGKLLVAELAVSPRKFVVTWNEYANANVDTYPKDGVKFMANLYGDDFDLVELDPKQSRVKICNNKTRRLCCLAEYEYEPSEGDGRFSLGVFEGNHTRDASVRQSMGFAVCTIMKCNSKNPKQCDSWDPEVALNSTTKFTKLELSGTFDPQTGIFPATWFHNADISAELERVNPDGRLSLVLHEDNTNLPLVSMTLYGRNFQLDGPLPHQFCPHDGKAKKTIPVKHEDL